MTDTEDESLNTFQDISGNVTKFKDKSRNRRKTFEIKQPFLILIITSTKPYYEIASSFSSHYTENIQSQMVSAVDCSQTRKELFVQQRSPANHNHHHPPPHLVHLISNTYVKSPKCEGPVSTTPRTEIEKRQRQRAPPMERNRDSLLTWISVWWSSSSSSSWSWFLLWVCVWECVCVSRARVYAHPKMKTSTITVSQSDVGWDCKIMRSRAF